MDTCLFPYIDLEVLKVKHHVAATGRCVSGSAVSRISPRLPGAAVYSDPCCLDSSTVILRTGPQCRELAQLLAVALCCWAPYAPASWPTSDLSTLDVTAPTTL